MFCETSLIFCETSQFIFQIRHTAGMRLDRSTAYNWYYMLQFTHSGTHNTPL
jgi:hypothetical protein